MSSKRDGKEEREDWDEKWETWTQPLEELGDMVDVFEKNPLRGKTVLDVGTYGVKPLYIALKYEPQKIIGITLDKPQFASEIAENSKLLTKTEINYYTCNFLEDIKLEKILKREKI